MPFFLSDDELRGTFVGRVWRPDVAGPAVVTVRGGDIVDITSREAPTVADVCDMNDPAGYVRDTAGTVLGPAASLAANRGAIRRRPISWRRTTCRWSRPPA